MKLESFQVKDFRSVNDTGVIKVEERSTVLVGRNESGKSSVLKALQSLKPASGPVTWGHARDFPRSRKRSDFHESAVMLETRWSLSAGDKTSLAVMWPRAAGCTEVVITRSYTPTIAVTFPGAAPLASLAAEARSLAAPFATDVSRVAIGLLQTEHQQSLQNASSELSRALAEPIESAQWAPSVTLACETLRAAFAAAGIPGDPVLERLSGLESAAAAVARDPDAQQAASDWVAAQLPIFVYLDDWAFVPGHHNIQQYVQRGGASSAHEEDKLFTKMLKVAELDAKELQDLLAQRHEERKLLTNRASGVVTETIQTLWKDREITVDFSLDADHFDVVIRDRDSNALVPLDERSRGFRWYFSFFITFAADTQGGDKANAVLLLDEPGLFLHAMAQEALLKFFGTLPNQIIYTTHSPFMIDPRAIATTRTVTLERGVGTTVSESPTGDANTLFPLQAALGYNLTQTLFIGTNTVVVEGVTDYWYLTAMSAHLELTGRALDGTLVLTPAGGAAKVGYMVALLAGQKLDVVVLLDSDSAGDGAMAELVRGKLVRDAAIVRIAPAHEAKPREADIEDLLNETVFLALVREAYEKELAGKALTLNPKVPRIVRRIEQAFEAIGVGFQKARIAKLFVNKLSSVASTAAVLDPAVEARFDQLFRSIESAMAKTRLATRPFQT
jgi:predicted ATPase